MKANVPSVDHDLKRETPEQQFKLQPFGGTIEAQQRLEGSQSPLVSRFVTTLVIQTIWRSLRLRSSKLSSCSTAEEW
jgi:hypothetical protein